MATPVTAAPDALTITAPGGVGRYALAGAIDEGAELGKLAIRAIDRLELDLAGVDHVNSVGLREWMNLLERCEERGVGVTLVRVSEPMVRQMNMIVEVNGVAEVESFFAPYLCPACDREESFLLECGELRALLRLGRLPAVSCAACCADMELNDFPESYFLFLDDDSSAPREIR